MFCLPVPASCLLHTLYASGFLPFDSRRAFFNSVGNAHSTIDWRAASHAAFSSFQSSSLIRPNWRAGFGLYAPRSVGLRPRCGVFWTICSSKLNFECSNVDRPAAVFVGRIWPDGRSVYWPTMPTNKSVPALWCPAYPYWPIMKSRRPFWSLFVAMPVKQSHCVSLSLILCNISGKAHCLHPATMPVRTHMFARREFVSSHAIHNHLLPRDTW